MIFNDTPLEDTLYILAALDGFAEGYKLPYAIDAISVDTAAVETVVDRMRDDFPHRHGLQNASAFKKVACFMVHFIDVGPIKAITYVDDIDQHHWYANPLTEFNRNAVFALHVAVELLHGVEIECNDGRKYTLSEPIPLTEHSYVDLLEALSQSGIEPCTHYMLIAILLEQLVYKSNPLCQYSKFVFGGENYLEQFNNNDGGQYDLPEAAE